MYFVFVMRMWRFVFNFPRGKKSSRIGMPTASAATELAPVKPSRCFHGYM